MSRISRNGIFILYISISLLILIIVYVMGENQNQKYLQDYNSYQEAVKLVANNQNQQAGTILKELVPRYQDSYQINYYYALYLSNIGDNKTAQHYYSNAAKLDPDLLTNPVFLLYYGENLYKCGRTSQAKTYLEQCTSKSNNAAIKRAANQILAKINGAR